MDLNPHSDLPFGLTYRFIELWGGTFLYGFPHKRPLGWCLRPR